MKKIYLLLALFLSHQFSYSQVVFNYTGGMQTYVVPLGTSAICFTVCGGKGMGNVNGNTGGGLGGRVMGTLPVVPGQVLQIFVGGGGTNQNAGGFNGGANGGVCLACNTDNGGGGGGASDIRFAPYTLADRQAVGGGGGGTGGDRISGCAPGCGGGGGGGWYGGGGGGAYGGSPGFGGSQVAGGLGGASCCGCPLSPLPGANGAFGLGGLGGGLTGGNNQAGPNPGCVGGVGGALIGGQGPNCTGGTGCPSTWAGASGAGGSNYTAPGVTGPTTTAGFQTGNGIVMLNPNCCASPTLIATATPSAICIGGTSTLTGTGAGVGGTYTWSPGGLTTTMITVSPIVTTIYTLQGTNTGSCTGIQTVQVTVNPLPIVLPGSNSPVCQYANINLTVNAFNTYSWTGPNAFNSNIQNPVIGNAQPINGGVYTVSVTDPNGCTNSGTTNVVINLAPIASPTNGGPYCVGATITLSVAAGVSYTWSGPSGFFNVIQNPSILNCQVINGGIYTVAVAGVGGCAATGTTNVIVNPLPTPSITINSPVCLNQQINFTGSGGTTYTWSGPGGFASNAISPIIAVAQMSNAGVYTLVVTNNNGCVNSTTANLVVNPLPIITITNPTVCLFTNINLASNGANTYAWSGPLAYTSLLQNPIITNAQLNMTGQYTVIGTSALGCTASAISNVLVLALPNPIIISNSPVCFGSTLSFTALGGASYIWAGPNGFTSVIPNPNISNVNMLAAGIYTLLTTVGICSASITSPVIINALPTPSIISNSPICIHNTINLFGAGGNIYVWAGPNGFIGAGSSLSLPSANNVNAGTYTLTVTDGNNCTNTVTSTVIINGLPIISAVGSTVCAAKTITLSASGGTSFAWVGPNGFASSSSTLLINNATPNMGGQYSVTVIDINGCISTSVTSVHINPLPTLTVSANSPICSDGTITLNSGATTGIYYVWAGPNGFNSTKQNPQITNAIPECTGIYTVTVTDNIGCSDRTMVSMIVNNLPIVSISSDNNKSCVPVCITFSPQSTTSIQTCYWKFGDGSTSTGLNASRCYKLPGSYDISSRFVDVNGCTNTGTFNVLTYPIPVADFNYEASKPIINEAVVFTDASRGAKITSWIWNFSHLKNKVILTPETTLSFENAGTYVIALIVMSDKGCKDTAIKSIIVGDDFAIYIPNAFTPDGDGLNDTFQPKGFGVTKYELNIFDRWGEKIFTTNDFFQGWDGSFSRRGLDEIKMDVYIWEITFTSNSGVAKELSGKVTLIR